MDGAHASEQPGPTPETSHTVIVTAHHLSSCQSDQEAEHQQRSRIGGQMSPVRVQEECKEDADEALTVAGAYAE